VNQLHPMVEKARENMAVIAPEAPQTIEVVLADAGYISEKNLAGIDPDGPEHLMARRTVGSNVGRMKGRRVAGCPILSRSEIGWRTSCSLCGGYDPCEAVRCTRSGGRGWACVGSDQGGSWDSAFYA